MRQKTSNYAEKDRLGTCAGRLLFCPVLYILTGQLASNGRIRDHIANTMDDIRDGQKTNSISKYIDSQAVRTNPFGDNRAGERAYRRAERIVAGLYLLTNHISGDEPVRSKVRANAADLLPLTLSLRNEMRTTQSSNVHALQANIRELISLVRILTVSGFVSVQNANIMIEALDELGTYIHASQKSILAESVALSRDELIDVRGPLLPAAPTRVVKDMRDTMTLKDTSIIMDREKVSVRVNQTQGQLSLRTQSIMDVLRSGGSLGIKDISANLPEYSEKMIQRELAELVALGQVKKAGLKRWSRYSLAQV